jgi:prepilin-type N-terminal cleavage/methylation domain-containing protein
MGCKQMNTNKDELGFCMKKAFTLVEILIVTAILGIMAAIVMPLLGGHVQEAREATAKENLRVLRAAVGRYAAKHNDVPPGYKNNDTSSTLGYLYLRSQLTIVEKYISELPENPFNGRSLIQVIAGTETLTEDMSFNTLAGWIYQPETKTIKLNMTGTDSEGKNHFDY